MPVHIQNICMFSFLTERSVTVIQAVPSAFSVPQVIVVNSKQWFEYVTSQKYYYCVGLSSTSCKLDHNNNSARNVKV